MGPSKEEGTGCKQPMPTSVWWVKGKGPTMQVGLEPLAIANEELCASSGQKRSWPKRSIKAGIPPPWW